MESSQISLAICLFEAIDDVNFSNIVVLLEKYRADPNIIIPNLLIAPIHYAVGFDKLEFAEKVTALFLRKGANANLLSEVDGLTPLHIATIWGRTNLVRMLLENGGDVDIKSHENQTAIMYAVHDDNFNVIQTIQKFVFEKKIEKKKKDLIIKSSQQDSNSAFMKRSEESTPIKNNHLKNALQNLEEKKFTPNRINYNFDATSPYYINITHRRHKTSSEASRNLFNDDDTTLNNESASENHSPINQPNLFDLTERNLKNFSRQMAKVIVVDRLAIHKRRSYIKDWREKIQQIRKSDTKLDIGYINYLNECNNVTLLKESTSEVSSDSEKSFTTAKSDLNRAIHAIKLLPEPKTIEHLEEDYIHSDHEAGIILFERKIISKSQNNLREVKLTGDDETEDKTQSSFSTKVTLPPLDYDTDTLRAELKHLLGDNPGPITQGTKKLYLKQMVKLKRNPIILKEKHIQATYSPELQRTISNYAHLTENLSDFLKLEAKMSQQFIERGNIKWREGNMKTSFIYLLIDPRVSDNLPLDYKNSGRVDVWTKFLASIFYVGKGKRNRPYSHLYDAIKLFSMENTQIANRLQSRKNQDVNNGKTSKENKSGNVPESKKLNRIVDIWRSQMGVVCVHVFNNIIPCEAFSREAAIIEAIGINNLTNMKRGDFYGAARNFSSRQKRQMGVALLHRAMNVYLAEGESQLMPFDLI